MELPLSRKTLFADGVAVSSFFPFEERGLVLDCASLVDLGEMASNRRPVRGSESPVSSSDGRSSVLEIWYAGCHGGRTWMGSPTPAQVPSLPTPETIPIFTDWMDYGAVVIHNA